MSERKNPLENRKESYVTIDEAAEYLRISRRTVYRWLGNGKLKFFQAGRGPARIPLSELEKFIEEHTKLKEEE